MPDSAPLPTDCFRKLVMIPPERNVPLRKALWCEDVQAIPEDMTDMRTKGASSWLEPTRSEQLHFPTDLSKMLYMKLAEARKLHLYRQNGVKYRTFPSLRCSSCSAASRVAGAFPLVIFWRKSASWTIFCIADLVRFASERKKISSG